MLPFCLILHVILASWAIYSRVIYYKSICHSQIAPASSDSNRFSLYKPTDASIQWQENKSITWSGRAQGGIKEGTQTPHQCVRAPRWPTGRKTSRLTLGGPIKQIHPLGTWDQPASLTMHINLIQANLQNITPFILKWKHFPPPHPVVIAVVGPYRGKLPNFRQTSKHGRKNDKKPFNMLIHIPPIACSIRRGKSCRRKFPCDPPVWCGRASRSWGSPYVRHVLHCQLPFRIILWLCITQFSNKVRPSYLTYARAK